MEECCVAEGLELDEIVDNCVKDGELLLAWVAVSEPEDEKLLLSLAV